MILLTALSVTIGALLITATASATSTATNSTAATGATSLTLTDVNQTMGVLSFGGFMAANGPGFGGEQHGGPGGLGQMSVGGGMMGMQNLEISSAYNSTVYSILTADSDVANLIAEGYNVTATQPIFHSVVSADGTVTTQASTAVVLMQNGTSGFASVNVDITNAKVTHIVIITRTIIDK